VEKHDLGLKAAVAAAAIPRSAYVFTPAPEARADVEALLSVFLRIEPKSIGGRLPDPEFYAEIPRR
jgi:NitT/TauT family transport system substrate-binding protein